MRLPMRIAIAALTTFVLSGATASPSLALSTNNPQWQRCEKGAAGAKFKDSACLESLESGEFAVLTLESGSREIKAKAVGSQELEVVKVGIVCKKLSLGSGSKVTGAGSEAISGGEATIKDEECEVTGQPSCEINKAKAGAASVSSKKLKVAEIYKSKEAAEKETPETITVLEPESVEGKKIFATIELSGTCTGTGTFNLEGELAFENVSSSTHQLELEIEAPTSAIGKGFFNSGKKTTERVIAPLKGNGQSARYHGGGAVFLGSAELWWLFH